MALIAAKSYYFGVGGSVADFCALVQADRRLTLTLTVTVTLTLIILSRYFERSLSFDVNRNLT